MMGGGRSKTEAKFDPKQVWLKNTVYLSNNLHQAASQLTRILPENSQANVFFEW